MGPTRITDLLEQRSHTHGDKTAWIDPTTGKQIPYSEVYRAVKRTSSRLRRYGISPGEHVGLLMNYSVELLIALFGVIRAGAIAVPFPTSWTLREQNRGNQSLEIHNLITDFDHEQRAYDLDGPDTILTMTPPQFEETIFVDQLKTGSDVRLEQNHHDALILFTSGTTGEPKPVRLTHGNLTAHARISSDYFKLTADETWLSPLPPYHMSGLGPAFRTLYAGATLLIGQRNLPNLLEFFRAYPVHLCSLVPTQLRRLIRHPSVFPGDSLRVCLTGGDRIPADLAAQALDNDVPLYGSYGSTEICSHVAVAEPSAYKQSSDDAGADPLPEMEITIEDEEIAVRGPTLSPGYLGTDTDCLRNGYFYTGDRGEWAKDGTLHVHGRLDDRITTGGETVSPVEIETVLSGHSGVEEAIVVGIPDPEWGQAVCAWIQTGDELTKENLEEYGRKRLASYKIPRHWNLSKEILKTTGGTADRISIQTWFEKIATGNKP